MRIEKVYCFRFGGCYIYLIDRLLVRSTSFLKPDKKEVDRFMIVRCG